MDPLTGIRIRAARATDCRYERDAPGDMIHSDVKKLGKIPNGSGWRADTNQSARNYNTGHPKVGVDYVHVAVDDHSKLALVEVHPDEKDSTCAGFLTQAAAFIAAPGACLERKGGAAVRREPRGRAAPIRGSFQAAEIASIASGSVAMRSKSMMTSIGTPRAPTVLHNWGMNDAALWALPLLGYVVALGSEVLRNSLQARREDAARVHDRQERLQERRDLSELEALKNVYASLDQLARAAMRFHLLDLEAAKIVGSYASHRLDEESSGEVDEEFRVAAVQLSMESELVLDDDLRMRLRSTRMALQRPSSMYHSTPSEADNAMNMAVAMVYDTQDAIGVRLRELYRVPSTE